MELSKKDRAYLTGVHPHLVKVFERAAEITKIDFKLTCGLRTITEQKALVAKGLSTTLNSRHLTGHALDVVPLVDKDGDGKISSQEMYDWPAYYALAKIIKQAAKDVGVPIEWGGDWKKFKDGPHWQLPHKQYPKTAKAAMGFGALSVPTNHETESQATVKEVAAISTVGLGGTGAALSDVTDTLVSQQYELSSGDWLRMAIAAVILGITAYAIIRKLRA